MIDWRTAIERPGVFDAVSRGGLTAWPAGGVGLVGDSLGPIMHAHDDASEIFYFLSGRCRLEVGRTEHLLDAGDFVLVPPEAPHNLWNASPDEPLVVFWLVAPNYADNRWRTEDFRPEGYERPLVRAHADRPGTLPSDTNIVSEMYRLGPGGDPLESGDPTADAILLVADGAVGVRVAGDDDQLDRGMWRHIPAGTPWSASGASPAASVIVMRIPHRAR